MFTSGNDQWLLQASVQQRHPTAGNHLSMCFAISKDGRQKLCSLTNDGWMLMVLLVHLSSEGFIRLSPTSSCIATETCRGVYCLHPLRRDVPCSPASGSECCHPNTAALGLSPGAIFAGELILGSYIHGLILGDLTWWGVPFIIQCCPLCSTPRILASLKAHPQGSVILPVS